MKEKISIVVPIYNCEQYISNCVTSILNQSYKNIEVLLVDDGSTDNSYSVCKEFEQKDSRVKAIHKENGGVSSARNSGIHFSTGKYVCFVDSDDWLDVDYCKILLNGMRMDADLSVSGYLVKNDQNYQEIEHNSDYIIMDKDMAYEAIFNNRNFFGFPFNKLYKKEILNKLGKTPFDENIHLCEDTLFNSKYLSYCNKIVYNTTQTYFYYQRPGSVTNSDVINDRKLSVFKSLAAMEEIYKNNSKTNLVFLYDFYLYNYYLIKVKLKRTKNNYKLKIKGLNKRYLYIMKSKKISLKKKIKISERFLLPYVNDYIHKIMKKGV